MKKKQYMLLLSLCSPVFTHTMDHNTLNTLLHTLLKTNELILEEEEYNEKNETYSYEMIIDKQIDNRTIIRNSTYKLLKLLEKEEHNYYQHHVSHNQYNQAKNICKALLESNEAFLNHIQNEKAMLNK